MLDVGCDIFKSPYSMYESRFSDLNITTVSTSSTHPDSLNLIQQQHHQHQQQQQTNDNHNHNSTNAGVIQSSTDAIGQHNNNDTSQMNNNNNLSQGIKTENQSPPNHATADDQESSRYVMEKPSICFRSLLLSRRAKFVFHFMNAMMQFDKFFEKEYHWRKTTVQLCGIDCDGHWGMLNAFSHLLRSNASGAHFRFMFVVSVQNCSSCTFLLCVAGFLYFKNAM